MIFQLLAGIVLAAFLFAAFLWSFYRAFVTQGYLRINAIVLSLATIVGMLGLTYGVPFLLLIAAPGCLLFSMAQVWTDPGWSKLLPCVQFVFGLILINVLMLSPALSP